MTQVIDANVGLKWFIEEFNYVSPLTANLPKKFLFSIDAPVQVLKDSFIPTLWASLRTGFTKHPAEWCVGWTQILRCAQHDNVMFEVDIHTNRMEAGRCHPSEIP